MKITNNYGLPEPLVRAIQNDNYTTGDCDSTVTRLIRPPRQVALEKLLWDEITEDASDRIWALLGQVVHLILERAATQGHVELRIYGTFAGWKIGGRMDLLDDVLTDYKLTSVWSGKDGIKPEWSMQLNLLACLCWQNQIPVKGAQIVAIYRDWSVREAGRDQNYPQSQVQVFQVPLLEPEAAVKLMEERVHMHRNATAVLPECADEDRWAKPEKWAVRKVGNQKAFRLCDSEQEATSLITDLRLDGGKVKWEIDYRPGEWVRCQSYCNCAPFCQQWQDHLKEAQQA